MSETPIPPTHDSQRRELIRRLANDALNGMHNGEHAAQARSSEIFSAVFTLAEWVIVTATTGKDASKNSHNRRMIQEVLQRLMLHTTDPTQVN